MNVKRTVAALLAVVPFAISATAYADQNSGVSGDVTVQATGLSAVASAEESVHSHTILTKVNELRASRGLPPVTRNAKLDAVAQDWSERMASRRSMGHRPNFAASYPAGWSKAAENVAMRGGSAVSKDVGAQIFDQWLRSPGHYANMVDPDLNSIGIGMARHSSSNSWYGTQNFARYDKSPR